MRGSLMICVALALASSAAAVAHDAEETAAAVSNDDYDANMPSADDLERWLVGFNALRHKHGDSHSAIFEAYNRFKDTAKSSRGEQALGLQEMRALLKDVGVGNMVLRTALVEVAFAVLPRADSGVFEKPAARAGRF